MPQDNPEISPALEPETKKRRGGLRFGEGQIQGRGRPLGLQSYARQKTREGKTLVNFFLRVLAGEPFTVTKLVMNPLAPDGPPKEIKWKQTPSLRHRMEAAAWLADRGFGKAVEKVDLGEHSGFLFVLRQPPGTYDPLQAESTLAEFAPSPPALPAPAQSRGNGRNGS